MKRLFATLALGLAYCQVAHAQSPDLEPSSAGGQSLLTTGESLVVAMENDSFDLFANRPYADRFYTHGTHASILTTWRPGWSSRLADVLRMGSEDTRISFSIVQNIYTPRDISLSDPSPDDRPYAGLLYGAAALIEASPRELNTLELRLGLVGPSALSWLAQDTRHDAIKIARANGWSYQLEDEPTASIAFEHRSAPTVVSSSTWGPLPRIERTHLASAEIGTLRTAAAVGGAFAARWGGDADYGPMRGWPGPMTAGFTSESTSGGYDDVRGRQPPSCRAGHHARRDGLSRLGPGRSHVGGRRIPGRLHGSARLVPSRLGARGADARIQATGRRLSGIRTLVDYDGALFATSRRKLAPRAARLEYRHPYRRKDQFGSR